MEERRTAEMLIHMHKKIPYTSTVSSFFHSPGISKADRLSIKEFEVRENSLAPSPQKACQVA